MKKSILPSIFAIIRWHIPVKIFLLLLAASLLSYWPLSTGLFALKNDALNYFLPIRYSIAESLRAGHLPYWSPYIYMGYPLNADLQGGAFNPVLWVISVFHPYTLASLHVETWLYLFIASLACYKLLCQFRLNEKICLLIALIYPLSGFFTDSGQNLAWLANAAFLPLVYLYFIRVVRLQRWTDSAKLALSLYLLLAAGYPFFFLAAGLFMILALFLYLITQYKILPVQQKKALALQLALAALLFSLLSIAPFLHFWEFLPYYARGSGVSLADSIADSLPPLSLLSLASPWAVSAQHPLLDADVALRNSYIGLLVLPFVVLYFSRKRSATEYGFAGVVLLTLLLALGKATPMHGLVHRFIPFMNSFRHPANYRLFLIQGLLFFAACGLHEFSPASNKQKRLLKTGSLVLLVCLVLLALWFMPNFQDIPSQQAGDGSAVSWKTLFQTAPFNLRMFVGVMIQLTFLLIFWRIIHRGNRNMLLALLFLNALVFQQLATFTSFVSSYSVRQVNRHFVYRSGFPLPNLGQGLTDYPAEGFARYPASLACIFNKQEVMQTQFTNPTYFSSYARFINDSLLRQTCQNLPVAFFVENPAGDSAYNQTALYRMDSTARIQVTQFGPNRFGFRIQSNRSGHLNLFQNHYIYWKARVDGSEVPIDPFAVSFMRVAVPAGAHEVEFEIHSGWRKWTYGLSILLFASLFLITAKTRKC